MGPVSPTSIGDPTAADGSVPLARLLAIAYRQLITELHAELEHRGWPEVRPAYGFALLALRNGPLTGGELAALMGMTKQAGSKLIEALVSERYVRRRTSRGDARARPVELTARGRDLLAASEAIYHDLEQQWGTIIGDDRVAALRADLTSVVSGPDGELPAVRPLW